MQGVVRLGRNMTLPLLLGARAARGRLIASNCFDHSFCTVLIHWVLTEKLYSGVLKQWYGPGTCSGVLLVSLGVPLLSVNTFE